MSIGSQLQPSSALPRPLRERGFAWAKRALAALVLVSVVAVAATMMGGEETGRLLGLTVPLLFWAAVAGFFAPSLYNRVRGRSDDHDRHLIVGQLAEFLRLGVPVPEALQALAAHQGVSWRSRWAEARRALLVMEEAASRGDGLGQAMGRTSFFPESWAVLLQAAERRDLLVEVLQNLELTRSTRSWVTAWFWIRLLVLWLIALPTLLFLCTYILPTFVALFAGLETRLPALTQALLVTSTALRSPLGMAVQLVPVALILLFILAHFRPQLGRRFSDWAALLPPFRQVLPLQDQSTVAFTLASSLRLGLSEQEALQLAALAVDHPAYRRTLDRNSQGIVGAIEQSPQLFARPLRWLARQGQEHGNLEQALHSAAVYLRDQADDLKQRWSIWLDAAITAVLGVFVAALVMGTYLPILEATMNLLQASILP